MGTEFTEFDTLTADDKFRMWHYLRKGSIEVLDANNVPDTKQAGVNLIMALDWVSKMIAYESQPKRVFAYLLVREYANEGLRLLNLPDDHVFEKNTLFLPLMVKHLKHLLSFAEKDVKGDQGFAAFSALISDNTLELVHQLANEYRRLMFMQLI